jgi:hypothetical protein
MAEPVSAPIDSFTSNYWASKVSSEREETIGSSTVTPRKFNEKQRVKVMGKMKRPEKYQTGPSTPRSSFSKGKGRSTMVFDTHDHETV